MRRHKNHGPSFGVLGGLSERQRGALPGERARDCF